MKLGTGNDAVVDAALASGCAFFAGYPVTPATEIVEVAAHRFPLESRCFVPAENEIAAIHMLAGASLAGYRALTATSGMGLSLMAEALSFFSGMSELPGVIVCQQRWGPGDGSLGPGQDSYHLATRGAGHGDFKLVVLAPSSVQETVDLTQLAFEMADTYSMFVIVLGDHLTALTSELYDCPPAAVPSRSNHASTLSDLDGNRVLPELVAVDSKGGEFAAIADLARRWEKKYQRIREEETRYELSSNDQEFDVLVVAYGSLARVAEAAIPLLHHSGVTAGVFRPITLWPFPQDALRRAASAARSLAVCELSMGQMIDDVRISIVGDPDVFLNWIGGEIPSPKQLADSLLERLNQPSVRTLP